MTQMNSIVPQPEFSSFRDVSGKVFTWNGDVYRQINMCYKQKYQHLMSSGLYSMLQKEGILISHVESQIPALTSDAFLVIHPDQVPFISYPYEWCFGQLKTAALVTLMAHKRALEYGMILKDASAYNIQFILGNAILIDTLSFDMYEEGFPWVAYGQFCRHFLAPLFLMSYTDIRLSQLLRIYIDGIPLDLASKLLKGKGGFDALQHIHWHAKATQKYALAGKENTPKKSVKISRFQIQAMIDSLIRIVEKLKMPDVLTEWGNYYANTNYTDLASSEKKGLVASYLAAIKPETVWDFGANDGTYSRLALAEKAKVVAYDIDLIAVERNYSAVKLSHEDMLPLLLDLTNPSPSIGFANKERVSLDQRQRPDCILMLAVIHHLAISNNLPLDMIAQWLHSLCKYLIIEFVPKNDSQVKILLATRDDIFPDYTQNGFENDFIRWFDIIEKNQITGSDRIIYSLKSKNMEV